MQGPAIIGYQQQAVKMERHQDISFFFLHLENTTVPLTSIDIKMNDWILKPALV